MELSIHVRLLVGISCFLIILFIVESIRKKKLREEYALIWLTSGITLLFFGIWPELLFIVSRILNLHYLSTLFLIAFVFLILIVLHFSIIISKLSDRTKILMQELSLLRFEIEQIEVSKFNHEDKNES